MCLRFSAPIIRGGFFAPNYQRLIKYFAFIFEKRLHISKTVVYLLHQTQRDMTTQEKLNKKFETLNKKYVKISKQMDKVANTQCTWEMEQQLENIQTQMSKISVELEEKGF
jgi:transketolase